MAALRLVWRGGEERTVTASGETVLEAAEGAGLSLPYGCRTGVCGTCTARLLAGDVVYERPPRALKRRHRDDGYVLPCVAVPGGDCTLEVGAGVQRDLLRNPWKRG